MIGSRRQAHLAAKAGNVLLNGVPAKPSVHVTPGDVVVYRKPITPELTITDVSFTVAPAREPDQPIDPAEEACLHAGERILHAAVMVLRPHLETKGKVKRAIKSGEITLNGEAVEETRRLVEGDLLRLRHDQKAALRKRDGIVLEVPYEDDDMAVCWKPSGIDTNGKDAKTLELALPHNLQPSTAGDRLKKAAPVHRLDKVGSNLGNYRTFVMTP